MTTRRLEPWEPYRPPAAAVDEATLWDRWRASADPAARTQLVERYMSYATALAAKAYARRASDQVEFDDYRQYAMVGLLEAVERYEPDRRAKFTTFATSRIQGAILNGLERLTERQQQVAFRRRNLAERTASFVPESLGVDPTERLLSQLEEIGVGVALGFILEGTTMVAAPDAATVHAAYAHVELRQVSERVWEMVKLLTERERGIIQMHYRDGRPFDEIAEGLGLTKGRISQLHRQAVLRLRELIARSERCDVTY